MLSIHTIIILIIVDILVNTWEFILYFLLFLILLYVYAFNKDKTLFFYDKSNIN